MVLTRGFAFVSTVLALIVRDAFGPCKKAGRHAGLAARDAKTWRRST